MHVLQSRCADGGRADFAVEFLEQECVPLPPVAKDTHLAPANNPLLSTEYCNRKISIDLHLLIGFPLVLLSVPLLRFEQGLNEGRQGEHSATDADSLGAPKTPNNVVNSFSTVHLLPKDLKFEHGGAKLVSCPGRYL